MMISGADDPPDLVIKNPTTEQDFISYDVSHPFTEDRYYVELVRKFFRNDVKLDGANLDRILPNPGGTMVVPVNKWLYNQ